MPNWLESMLGVVKGRMGTANSIAIILTIGYVFIQIYSIAAIFHNVKSISDAIVHAKAIIEGFEKIVMVVVSNILIIKGIETNTEK